MSVWSEIVYNTDTLSTFLRYISPADSRHPCLHKLCTAEYEGNQCVGDQLPIGPITHSIAQDMRVAFKIEPHSFSRMHMASTACLNFLNTGVVHTGLSAVYQIYCHAYHGRMRWSNEWQWKWLKDFVAHMMRLNQYASYQSAVDARDWIDRLLKRSAWHTNVQRFDNFAATFQHLRSIFNTDSHKADERRSRGKVPPPLRKSSMDLGKGWEARRFGPIIILTLTEVVTPVHHVLTQKDLNRLVQMFSSTSDMEMYFGLYTRLHAEGALYGGYKKVMLRIVSAMEKNHRVGEIARACDVAAYLLPAIWASDVWDKSIRDQEAKIYKEKLNEILNVKGLTDVFLEFPMAEATELSKVYKFLPVPDYDFLTLFDLQRQQHEAVNPVFGDNDLGLSIEDFTLYQRHQLILTYHANHGVCPGEVEGPDSNVEWQRLYPHINPNTIPYRHSNRITFTTPFRYTQVEGHHNPYIKDKALAPNFLERIPDEPALRDLPPRDTKYIMHYTFSPVLATPENVALGRSEEPHSLGHHTAPKGETKKGGSRAKPPRNFYINTYPGRVLVSELDNNVADYIRDKPGCFTGLSRAQAFNKFREMAGTELERAQSTYVHISFDLEAWSPRQNPALRRLQLAKWAEAFGKQYIHAIDDQFTKAKVYFIHKGIKQEYQLQGNDLEGYLARVNTDLHVDIMGYAVRKLRERGVIQAGAKLAVQIDDGLCVLRFPPDTPNQTVIDAVGVIEQIYEWFSLKISWDKTYVSRRLRVFLNELEYDDIRITPGVKAFLRIRREGADGIRCFLREVNKAAGHISGAIEAGCPPALAWMKYAFEVGKSILDWTRRQPIKPTPDEAALWAFTPVAFGGSGCLSMLQYSSNCTDNATAAGISILKAIATYDPVTRPTINKIINQPILARSPSSTIRDPMKFRIEGHTLTDLLEITYAKAALRGRVQHPAVLEALALSDSLASLMKDQTYEAFIGTRGKALELAYEASLLSTLDSLLLRFTRSSTVISLIGSRNALRVRTRYIRNLRDTLHQFLMVIRSFR